MIKELEKINAPYEMISSLRENSYDDYSMSICFVKEIIKIHENKTPCNKAVKDSIYEFFRLEGGKEISILFENILHKDFF